LICVSLSLVLLFRLSPHPTLFPYTTLFRSELLRITEELDDLLQILLRLLDAGDVLEGHAPVRLGQELGLGLAEAHGAAGAVLHLDRKSTRLNSSHVKISYAVFCLKKKISTT